MGWFAALGLAGLLAYLYLRPKKTVVLDSPFRAPMGGLGKRTGAIPPAFDHTSPEAKAKQVLQCRESGPGPFGLAMYSWPKYYKPMVNHHNRGCPPNWIQGRIRYIKPNTGTWHAEPENLQRWDGEVIPDPPIAYLE